MNTQIAISGISAFAYHGVYDHERESGQQFFVDLDIHGDFIDAAKNDDLAFTENYAEIIDLTKEVMQGVPVNLIEHLAFRIGQTLLKQFPRISKIAVTVHKPHAPVEAKVSDISFTITMDRE